MTAELGIFNGHLSQHLLAALWFLFCWVGYTRYATWKGRDTACLASVLHLYREDWMRRLLLRDNRIADASVIGNLERNASFFASSTLIILAGILTLLGSTDRAVSVLADLPFVEEASRGLSELKLLCLAVVFVYAFFTFSWCMRQYNFAAILVGSAPMIGERNVGELERKSFAERAARVISLAANQFNFGLRSYYFGLAMLAWFINSWFFMLVTYRRGAGPVSPRVPFGRAGGDGLHRDRNRRKPAGRRGRGAQRLNPWHEKAGLRGLFQGTSTRTYCWFCCGCSGVGAGVCGVAGVSLDGAGALGSAGGVAGALGWVSVAGAAGAAALSSSFLSQAARPRLAASSRARVTVFFIV